MTEFISTCSMPLAVIFLIVGFFFLVKGADIFVEGSSSIAKRFHVPAIIIGLTIVAMGTSLRRLRFPVLQQSSIRIRWQSVMWSGLIFLI